MTFCNEHTSNHQSVEFKYSVYNVPF